MRNRSLQDLTRWDRRNPEAYLIRTQDETQNTTQGKQLPPLEQLEVLLEELPGDVSPSTVLGNASNQMNRVLTSHTRPNAEVQRL